MTCGVVEAHRRDCKDATEEAKRHPVVHAVLSPPMGARGEGPGCHGRRCLMQVEDVGEVLISCRCEARQKIGRVDAAP
jgi:hypothetical protein